MADTNDWMPNVRQVEDDDSQAMSYVRSLFAEGRIDEARAELRALMEKDPENTRPVVALGLSLMRERRLEEAAQLFERAMEIDPADEVPPLLAAQVGLRGDNPEYSEIHFHKALAINPTSIQALTGLGRLHLRNDNPEEAIAVFERALEIDPQSRMLRHQIATVCADQGRHDEAQAHLQHLLSVFPGDEQASIQLANVHHRKGDTEAALDLLREAQEAHPDHAGLLVAQGHILNRAGRHAEAETPLRRAMAIPRSLPETPAQPPGQADPGAEFMRRIAEWWRQQPRMFAQILLIQALIPQNKLAEARQTLARMPRQGPMAAVVQRLYGDAFAFEGNLGAAEQSYRAALHAARGGEALLREVEVRKSAEGLEGAALLSAYTEALDRNLEQQFSAMTAGRGDGVPG